MSHLESASSHGSHGSLDGPNAFSHSAHPARQAHVEDLIRRAQAHPLGLPFLVEGMHDSVAATFGVHAFVLDEARERLRGGFEIRG